jgi:hypothetical protein
MTVLSRLADLIVAASVLYTAWRIAHALSHAIEIIQDAPRPGRLTPEPPRLRLVRPVYDWQRDGAA